MGRFGRDGCRMKTVVPWCEASVKMDDEGRVWLLVAMWSPVGVLDGDG